MLGFPRFAPRAGLRRGSALALGAALLACGRSDDSERVAAAIPPPLRVVSLAPAATELVIALGARSALVAVDAMSGRLPGLDELPVVDLAGSAELEPDLVVVPELGSDLEPVAEQLRVGCCEVIEAAPHDFDDAFALCRELGARLVGAVRTERLVNEMGRELARLSGASFGRPRPRIAALLGAAPLELAGGHSFATDLIELAGGSSVTHGGGERQVRMSAEQLVATAPDLVLVISAAPLTPDEREAVRAALPDELRLGYFAFDANRFWVRDAVDTARRLRAMVEPLSRELERPTSRGHASHRTSSATRPDAQPESDGTRSGRTTVPVTPAKFVGEFSPTTKPAGVAGVTTLIESLPSLGITPGGIVMVW